MDNTPELQPAPTAVEDAVAESLNEMDQAQEETSEILRKTLLLLDEARFAIQKDLDSSQTSSADGETLDTNSTGLVT